MGSEDRQRRQGAHRALTELRDGHTGSLATDLNTAAAVLASLSAARREGVTSGFLRAISELGAIARARAESGELASHDAILDAIEELSHCVEVNEDD